MKKLISFIIVFTTMFVLTASSAFAYTRVKGYYKRSSGSYVMPHYRTSSDSYKWNNWSSRGNYNYFTGKKGYKK